MKADLRKAAAVAKIKRIVAEEFGVTVQDLEGKRGPQKTGDARHVAMILVREFTGASFPETARAFNRPSHRSAMHAVKVIRERSQAADGFAFASLVESIRNKIRVVL